MSNASTATAETTSIFEEAGDPSPNPPDGIPADTAPESNAEPETPENAGREEEKHDVLNEQIQIPVSAAESDGGSKYPPNSMNEAKANFQRNKARDAHKYVGGSPPRKRDPKSIVSQMSEMVDDMKQQMLPKFEAAGDVLIRSADDAVKSLSSSTGIEFAPIDIPMKRRRQTLAVLVWSSMYLIALVLNFVAIRYWSGWKFYLYLFYLCWKGMYQTFHRNGGLPIPWFRHSVLWKWFTDYFPIRLHKKYELDSSGETSYLFGYHPHGIIGVGAVGTFGMMTSGFDRLFPAVDVRLLTLKINFYVPFFDLLISFLGMCDASRESCNAILGDQDDPKSLCLVLGGAKESLEAHPGRMRLYLANRKGFVKVALENGATLVPVFGFGENELFDQVANPQGSVVRKIQNQLQKRMGFAIPLFHGRGVFQYNYGLLPKRIPIDVVFGKPIACPRMTKAEITPDVVDEYHRRYCAELKNVFDAEKHKYYPQTDELPEMEFF